MDTVLGLLDLNMCLLELKHVSTGSKQQMETAPSTGNPPNTDYLQLGAKEG